MKNKCQTASKTRFSVLIFMLPSTREHWLEKNLNFKDISLKHIQLDLSLIGHSNYKTEIIKVVHIYIWNLYYHNFVEIYHGICIHIHWYIVIFKFVHMCRIVKQKRINISLFSLVHTQSPTVKYKKITLCTPLKLSNLMSNPQDICDHLRKQDVTR